MNLRPLGRLGSIAILGVLLLAALPWAARAQVESREAIALQNQVLELRNEVEALRAQIAAGAPPVAYPYQAAPAERPSARELTPELLTRLTTLEDEVRTLTGRVDQLANQVQRQGDLLTKQIGDLSFRVQNLEGGRGGSAAPRSESRAAAPSSPPPANPTPSTLGALPLVPPPAPYAAPRAYAELPAYTPPAGPPPYASEQPGGALPLLPPPEPEAEPGVVGPSPQTYAGALPLVPPAQPEAAAKPATPARTADQAIRDARAALLRHDYAAAEEAAREALGTGTVSRGADAQYVLAEALAGEHNYPQAAIAYDDAYRRSPTGPHAQESLLGMANALANVGAKPAACAALDKLKSEFLTQRASVRDAAVALRQRAACRS